MTDEEIIRPLKAIRHGSPADRIRRRTVTLSDVARETGITRGTLHKIASGELPIGPKTRSALRTYFECIEDGSGGTDPPRPDRTVSVATGSGSVFTVKWPDFGPKRHG